MDNEAIRVRLALASLVRRVRLGPGVSLVRWDHKVNSDQ